MSFDKKYKILVPSKVPADKNYIAFMNKLEIGIGVVDTRKFRAVGTDFDLSNI